MIALKRILVPTDFGEASDCALRYGRAFAERFRAELHVLHVVESVLSHVWPSEAFAAPLPGIVDSVQRDAADRLNELMRPEVREACRASLVVRVGIAHKEIVRYAVANGVDLIVMGTHGRGPVEHMLLGSVAERVVRRSACPVLTVRHPQHEFVLEDD